MMLAARGAIRASGAGLPYDAEVEYLESSGTQWIDTGIIGGSSSKVEISASSSNTAQNMGLFGSRNTSLVKAFTIWQRVTNTSVRFDFADDTTNRAIANAAWDTSGVNTVIKDGPNNTLNGVVGANNATATFTCEYPFYLFSINTSGTATSNASARVYSCKIWQNSILVRDYIPVRKKTVGYLYDRVSGKLFGNAGTGDFVLGPDIVPVEFIESFRGSGGGQFINTGIRATTSTKWEIDLAFTTTVTGQLMGSGFSGNQRFNIGIESSAFRGGFGGGWFTISNTRDTNRHLWRLESLSTTQCEASIDGGAAVSYTSTFSPYSEPIILGRRYVSESMTNGARYYANKIWTSGDLVQTLRPVRVGTEGAMIDTLTRRIYRNAGTGAFTFGNDLKYPIPA